MAEILEIHRGASKSDIKKAYHKVILEDFISHIDHVKSR